MVKPWQNKKTGKIYYTLMQAIDKTNERSSLNLRMMIYSDGEECYARDLVEFLTKFDPL